MTPPAYDLAGACGKRPRGANVDSTPPGADDEENAMAFAIRSASPMADMNVTPLVDVMLVMLIIFMITMPAVTRTLGMDLPQRSIVQPKDTPPEPVRLHVDAGGTVSWNGSPVSLGELQAKLQVEGARGIAADGSLDASRQPAIEIDAEREADYQLVMGVMARASNAQLAKIGLVQPGG
jgi:biopolymer transport protein ExbD